MGYLIPKTNYDNFISEFERWNRTYFQWKYQPDVGKAYPSRIQTTYHRYLQYQKDKGWIKDFYPLSLNIKMEVNIRGKDYIYHPDFKVLHPFDTVYHDIKLRRISQRHLRAIRKLKLAGFNILIITAERVKQIRKAYKGEFSDFFHRSIAWRSDYQELKENYHHFER